MHKVMCTGLSIMSEVTMGMEMVPNREVFSDYISKYDVACMVQELTL